MAKSIKPTLIASAIICLPFLLLGGYLLHQENLLTVRNVALLLVAAPFIVAVLIASTKGPDIAWNAKDLAEHDKPKADS